MYDSTTTVDGTRKYRREIGKFPMLSHEQEMELTSQMQDPNAMQELVNSHLRLVISIAREYQGYGLPNDDLVQEGTVGLLKAVKRFDPNRGVLLSTFATYWIKAEIHEYVIKNWRQVRVATTKPQRKLFFNLRHMKANTGKGLTQSEVDHITSTLNVSAADVREMDVRMYGRDVSLHCDDNDDDAFAPVDYLVADNAEPTQQLEQQARERLLGPQLQHALEQLDERSRRIVHTRWLDDSPKTLHELAAEYNVSAERIRQIEVSAMKKLRKFLS